MLFAMPISERICLPVPAKILRTVDPNLPQQAEPLSKYKTGRPRRRKRGRPLKDNICYGEGRSVGRSVGRGTEGRKAGARAGGKSDLLKKIPRC